MTIAEIESSIEKLPREEFMQLARWFTEIEEKRWDADFKSDAVTGRLDLLAAEAVAEYNAGRTNQL